MSGLNDFLEHVPALVKAYGKWPRYVYLLLATVITRCFAWRLCFFGLEGDVVLNDVRRYRSECGGEKHLELLKMLLVMTVCLPISEDHSVLLAPPSSKIINSSSNRRGRMPLRGT